MVSPESILANYWGHTSFRPPQAEVIQSVLSGKDVLAILPTGGGKSVCFQVPALAMDGLCVVITPLIALMQDQVEQLKKKGIAAIAIHSGLTHQAIDILLDNCVYGKQKFLYVSPERLQTELFQVRFQKMNVNLIAVDEAHCISQWGYDFRPPYLQIADLRELKPMVPIIALTASATTIVKDDIVSKLQMRSPSIFQISFARHNVSLVVRKAETKEKQLIGILTKVLGSAIVYVRSRRATQEIAQMLQRNKISAAFYHAGLSHQERTARQREWINDNVRVIVATNAFGMGIDKSNVRLVVHLDIPEDIESYYQEAGRAGRDGLRAYATMIHHTADTQSLRNKVEQSQPSLDYLKKIYQALANHFQVAVGSNQGESYDFDLDHFCKVFSFKASSVYPALKKLEENGLVTFNESFYRPSRVLFLIDKKGIYEFQVANARFDPMLKSLLRLFGGQLYSDFVTISETQLASSLKVSVEQVKMDLQHLHDLQLLVYEKSVDGARITFVLPRQDAERLPIDRVAMEARRALHFSKMESIIHYVEQTQRCRMQIIQEYFDEITYNTCGICDVCINKRKRIDTNTAKDYEDQIAYLLADKSMSPEELEALVAPKEKEMFTEVLRELLEAGEVYYDEHWMLHKKNSQKAD